MNRPVAQFDPRRMVARTVMEDPSSGIINMRVIVPIMRMIAAGFDGSANEKSEAIP